MNLISNFPLYDPAYNSIPFEELYLVKYKVVPSKMVLGNEKYSIDAFSMLLNDGFTIQVRYSDNSLKEEIFLLEKHGIFLRAKQCLDGDLKYFTFTFFYDIAVIKRVESLVESLEFFKIDSSKNKNRINLIKFEFGQYDLYEYEVKHSDVDIETNYDDDFLVVHNVIVERLNTDHDKGIVLLHGLPGTGKTNYLRYLTSILKKRIIFVPPSMSEMLMEPSLIPFLMEHKNSILVIEDAERVITDRLVNNSSSSGVSNILNITDGLLGDCLNIQIIATFNTDRDKIDKALLRGGRLIAEHKFGKLTVEKTNKLLKKLGKTGSSTEGLVLADIYNFDKEVYRSKNEKNKIGFKNA